MFGNIVDRHMLLRRPAFVWAKVAVTVFPIAVCFALLLPLPALAQTVTVPTAGTHNPAGAWTNFTYTAQTAAIEATFTYQSSETLPNSDLQFSDKAADSFNDDQASIRIKNGVITALNGTAYTSQNVITYNPGALYAFRLVIDIPANRYDAYVTEDSGSEQVIGLGYSFPKAGTLLDHFILHGFGEFVLSDVTLVPVGGGGDTTAPTAPGNLALDSVADTSANLSWSASSDNVGVTGYDLYRDGALIATQTGLAYNDTGLSPASNYDYHVIAFDAAGNRSASSAILTITTNSTSGSTETVATAGTYNPAGSWINFTFAPQTGTVEATFTYQSTVASPNHDLQFADQAATAFGDTEAGVRIKGGFITALNGTTFMSQDVIPYTANALYEFRLVLNIPNNTYDAYLTEDSGTEQVIGLGYAFRTGTTLLDHFVLHGWGSFDLSDVTLTTSGGGSDTQAPTVPTNLTASAVTENSLNLTWSASTDDVGVTGYELYRNGVLIATQTGLSFADSGLSPGTAYAYHVIAMDAAGNRSANSATLDVTTASGSGGTVTVATAGTHNPGSNWINFTFAPQTDTVEATFTYQSGVAIPNHYLQFSDRLVDSFTDGQAGVRIKNDLITALNGSSHMSQDVLSYTAGALYQFRLVLDIPNDSYDAYLTQDSGSEQVIGLNYAFRNAGTLLDRFAIYGSGAFDLSDVTLTGNSGATNVAPVVTAGVDFSVEVNTAIALSGSVSDDGLPNPPAAVTSTWSQVSGAGTAIFTNASSPTSDVSFDVADTYVLRLTADDSELTSTDDVTVTVTAAVPTNQPPTADAGPDLAITLPASANLIGAATDDGLPNPPAAVSAAWSVDSGPGTVSFDNAASASTTATFSTAGSYVLRLTADDGSLQVSDTVTITVSPPAVCVGP